MTDRIFAGMDPVTIHGAFYTIFVPLSVFMVIYDEMIREKMQSLRFGLLVIGCSNAAFWISWLITGIFFSAIMSSLMFINGYLFNFDLFINSPFYVLFSIYFAVSNSYVCLAAAL